MASFVSWAVVAVGAIVRVRQYLFNRSIWNDEAELALNIINRSFLGLTHPLASAQGAPIGFLWAEKLATELFGNGSEALRLVPLLSALVGLVVYRSLAVSVAGAWPGCLALALFALSPALVYYSSEAKQYGVDVTVVLVILWYADRLLPAPVTWRAAAGFGLVCGVAVWCSFPAAVAAGASCAVLVGLAVTRRRQVAPVVTATLLWLCSFGVEYLVSLRQLRANTTLQSYWSVLGAFAPKPLHVGTSLRWMGTTLKGMVAYPFNLDFFWLALLLLLLGLVTLLVRRRPFGLVITLMLVAVAVGGIIGAYPVNGRMVLFLSPVAVLLLAASTTSFASRPVQAIITCLVLVVTLSIFSQAAAAFFHPYTRTEGREALAYAESHRGPGGAILVEGSSVNLYTYYHETTGIDATGNIWLYSSTANCAPPGVSWLSTHKRLVVVYAPAALLDQQQAKWFGRFLGVLGKTVHTETWRGAIDYVIKVNPNPSFPLPRAGTGLPRQCVGVYLYPTR